MPALTRSLWAGFPTSRWHCLAVLSGRLPPPFTLFFFFFFFLESILRRPRRPLSSSSCVAHHQLPSAHQDTLGKGYFEFLMRAQPRGGRLFAFMEGHELPDTCQPLFTPHTQVSIIYHQNTNVNSGFFQRCSQEQFTPRLQGWSNLSKWRITASFCQQTFKIRPPVGRWLEEQTWDHSRHLFLLFKY